MGFVSRVRLATSYHRPASSVTRATQPVLSALDQMPTSVQTVQGIYNWTPGPPIVSPAVRRDLLICLLAVTAQAPMGSARPLPGNCGKHFLL